MISESLSLLSILFMTFHLTDDIIFGMVKGGLSNFIAVPILVVWLYGTLVLAERRSGYVIILVGSLLGLLVPVLYMTWGEWAASLLSPAELSSSSGRSSHSV
jgi:hypothetical protein